MLLWRLVVALLLCVDLGHVCRWITVWITLPCLLSMADEVLEVLYGRHDEMMRSGWVRLVDASVEVREGEMTSRIEDHKSSRREGWLRFTDKWGRGRPS